MLKLRQSIKAKVKIFDEVIRLAKSERVALTLLRDKKRWLCRNDLFYLCCLTGNHKIKELPAIFEPFCDEVSLMNWQITRLGIQPPSDNMLRIDEVTDNVDEDLKYTQRLYLAHRGFYKTTIVTKVHTLQLLLNFPNIRIVLNHNKQENSSDNLRTIKNYFLETYIGVLFPEYVPKGKEWGNMRGFSVACKTDIARSEDSLEAIGVGTEITGRHWDAAKPDDLVTEDSVTTEDQINKVKDYDDRFNAGHFTNPEIKLQDYSGTRYHYNDLYSVKKNNPHIKLIEIPLEDGNGNPTHPERFTPESIVKIKSGLDAWVYNCQHLLRPDDPARMTFRQEMIQYYGSGCKIEGIPQECNFYLLVDPASKRKKKSDYTAMMVIGIDSKKRRFIADMMRDKLNPQQRINMAIELAKKWGIKESAWEEVGLGDDNFYLEEQRRKEELFFTITPVKTQSIAKEDRIRNILMPEYAEHKWFWPVKGSMIRYSTFDGKNFDLTEVLEDEFIHFPLWEHDDLLDCGTFLSQLSLVIPEELAIEEYQGMTFGDYIKIKEDRLNYERKRPWTKFRALERV